MARPRNTEELAEPRAWTTTCKGSASHRVNGVSCLSRAKHGYTQQPPTSHARSRRSMSSIGVNKTTPRTGSRIRRGAQRGTSPLRLVCWRVCLGFRRRRIGYLKRVVMAHRAVLCGRVHAQQIFYSSSSSPAAVANGVPTAHSKVSHGRRAAQSTGGGCHGLKK